MKATLPETVALCARHGYICFWSDGLGKWICPEDGCRSAALLYRRIEDQTAAQHEKVGNNRGHGYVIPAEPGPSRWLSLDDLADWLSAEPEWIEAKIQAGMPHALVAGNVRFQAEEVRRWLQS